MTNASSALVQSIRGEYLRYKSLAEKAIDQLRDEDLGQQPGGDDNSIATICWHISGNLQSRFADFLTTDGEKPSRDREREFDGRRVSRTELLEYWNAGWATLMSALGGLTDADLGRTITIRQQPLLVHEALHRSLAHAAYHVGQIVYVAKHLRGAGWTSLSIPRGQSAAYNQHPTSERPPGR